MKTNLVPVFAATLCIFFIVSCQKDTVTTTTYSLDVYDSDLSPKEQIGRVLFYDNSLSINNSMSCGTCHKQANAFADNKQFHLGFDNTVATRNTPTIQNLSSGEERIIFWDGRSSFINQAVLEPVFNHAEMGMREPEYLVELIKNKSYYQEMFKNAYGTNEVTLQKISETLGAFVFNLQSNNSKLETGSSNTFSESEMRGFNLFHDKYDCGSCHNVFNDTGYNVVGNFNDMPSGGSDELREFFIKNSTANIGLDAISTDRGVGAVLNDAEQDGKFKIPTLKNIELTAPYMHDGRFGTLEEVIDHYSLGVADNPNLDDRLKDEYGNPLTLNITNQDKKDLIAFLKTFTDNEFITNPSLSDPFSVIE